MLTLIGCIPTDSGTVVLSVNRLFTDQVTGFGSRLKKRVGRKQIGKAVAEHFRALREELEKLTPGQQGG
jgi:hypothetical protein